MSLYTGARRANVQAMAWAELDLAGQTWVIPADKAKAGKPMHLHLPQAAMDILQRRQKARQKSNPWVFPCPGEKPSATGHLQEPKFQWKQLLKRASIADLHLHDLRRSLGSWMAATGASLPLIGKQLGHADVATTAIYSRLNIDPTRTFVDAAVEAMKAAGRGQA